MIKTLIQRATGTTPQTNGTSASDDWREGCGYNHFFEHEIVWDQGHYTGLDEEWGSVGIPYNVLLDINSNAKGSMDGILMLSVIQSMQRFLSKTKMMHFGLD